MIKKGEQTRNRLLETVGNLLKSKGYNGIGLQEIVRESRTPKGSLYFHFPGGKKELVETAIKQVGKELNDLLNLLFQSSADLDEGIKGIVDFFINELETSNFQKGCPIATTTMDTASIADTLQKVCCDSFRLWEKTIADNLQANGLSESDSTKQAIFLLSTIEGAIVLCQAHKNIEPLKIATESLLNYVRFLKEK